MRKLGISVSLHNGKGQNDIAILQIQCENAVGGIKILPVHLDVEGDPIIVKRRVLPYGLRDAVKHELSKMKVEEIIKSVESTQLAIPIVTLLKKDGQTLRICDDYRITVDKALCNYGCTTEEPEDILNRMAGAARFTTIDLKTTHLQIPLDEKSSNASTINTPFGMFRYRFLPF